MKIDACSVYSSRSGCQRAVDQFCYDRGCKNVFNKIGLLFLFLRRMPNLRFQIACFLHEKRSHGIQISVPRLFNLALESCLRTTRDR